MTKQIINVGSGEYSGDGESLRSALVKTNENFSEVYTNIDIINNAGYLTSGTLSAYLPYDNDTEYLTSGTVNQYVNSFTITNISYFNNDVEYLTTATLPPYPTVTTDRLINGTLNLIFNDGGHLVFPAGSEHYDLGAGSSILSHNIDVNSNSWAFNSDASLTLPGDVNFKYGGAIWEGGHGQGGRGWQTGLNIVGAMDNGTSTPIRIYPHGGDGKGLHMGAINVKSDRVEIYGDLVNDSVGTFWTFKNDGSTTFPNGAKLDGGISYKFATDNSVTEYIDLRDTSGRGFYTDGSGYTLRTSGSKSWVFDTAGVLSLPECVAVGAAVIQPASNGYNLKLISNGNTWNFDTDGNLTVPNSIIFSENSSIRDGMGFDISSESAILLQSVDATDPNNKFYNNWVFGLDGSLTVPGTIFPVTFTVTLTPEYFIGHIGHTVLTLADDPWQYTITFDVNDDGTVLAWHSNQTHGVNPGYQNGDRFNFGPEVTGILGYTFRLNLSGISYSGTEWYTTAFSSLSPQIIPTIVSESDLKFTNQGGDLILRNNGSLILPGNLRFSDGQIQTTAWNDQAFMASMATYDGAIVTNTATIGVGGLTVDGPVIFNGPFTFQSTVTTQVTGSTGTFFGDTYGVGALYAGVAGYSPLPATVFQSSANVNDYIQNNFQNLDHGVTASTEWVATNDTGDDTNNYIDMGIAGHQWDGSQANSVGTAAGPSDSWLYVQGTTTSNEGGNLILGTIKDGKSIKILAGSNGAGSVVAQFNSSGLALNTGTGITFADGTHQTTAISSSGTVVLSTLNVTNLSATNITINGQSISAGVTKITAGTGTHVSTTTGALTLWVDTFNTSTLVAQAVTALSIPYANVSGTPNLAIYATISQVSSLPTTATVVALIANSLTNYVKIGTTATFIGTGTASSTNTGILQVQGGAGISGNLYANTVYSGDGYFRGPSGWGNIQLTSGGTVTVAELSINSTGLIKGPGGSTHIGLLSGTGGSVKFYNTVTIAGTTSATSTTTGALTVSGGVGISGDIYANKFVGDGSNLTNVTFSQAGNIIGTNTNVTLVAGSYSYTFDNAGTLTLPSASIGSGNEGGEIDFGKAPNSTLTGTNVVIDQYADRFRFFESGGSVRGAYIDLSIAAAGVGTLLNNRASGFVNAGVDVTLGNLRARIPTSGNRSLQISTVSGTYSVYGSDIWYAGSTPGGNYIDGASPLSVTTTPTYLRSGNNFTAAGYIETWTIMDPSAGLAWRITCIYGMSYNNNMISIERLV